MPSSTATSKIATGVTDGFGALQRTAAREHRQPAEQSLLRDCQERMTPLERVPKRLLSGRQIRRAACQQVQPRRQSRAHLCRGEDLDARGRQLQGQWQSVEPDANLRHRAGIFGTQRERTLDGGCALHEEPHRGASGQIVDRCTIGLARHAQWGHRVAEFPGHVQDGPACHEDLQRSASVEQRHQQRRGRDELLEVIENEQRRFPYRGPRVVPQRLDERPPFRVSQPDAYAISCATALSSVTEPSATK